MKAPLRNLFVYTLAPLGVRGAHRAATAAMRAFGTFETHVRQSDPLLQAITSSAQWRTFLATAPRAVRDAAHAHARALVWGMRDVFGAELGRALEVLRRQRGA